MCIVFLAFNSHPDYKLIVAGNRDEFYSRPTSRMNWWQEYPYLLAGKDLEKGGTWLGITKTGRFATLTNYRDFTNPPKNGPSRGRIVLDWLLDNTESNHFLNYLNKTSDVYDGYNLIAFDGESLFWQSNITSDYRQLDNGIYSVSNALLDTPWRKTEKGKNLFKSAILLPHDEMLESIFLLLSDDEKFPDEELPKTGLPIEMERLVSSIFIKSEIYGSRVASIVLIDNNDNVEIIEKSYLDFINLKFNFKTDKTGNDTNLQNK